MPQRSRAAERAREERPAQAEQLAEHGGERRAVRVQTREIPHVATHRPLHRPCVMDGVHPMDTSLGGVICKGLFEGFEYEGQPPADRQEFLHWFLCPTLHSRAACLWLANPETRWCSARPSSSPSKCDTRPVPAASLCASQKHLRLTAMRPLLVCVVRPRWVADGNGAWHGEFGSSIPHSQNTTQKPPPAARAPSLRLS